MYCYLKARFGEPNGVQNILRSDSSDNWIHWEYSLKADGEDISIGGTYREVHFMLTEEPADADWPVLLKKNQDGLRAGRTGEVGSSALAGEVGYLPEQVRRRLERLRGDLLRDVSSLRRKP